MFINIPLPPTHTYNHMNTYAQQMYAHITNTLHAQHDDKFLLKNINKILFTYCNLRQSRQYVYVCNFNY